MFTPLAIGMYVVFNHSILNVLRQIVLDSRSLHSALVSNQIHYR